METKYSKTEFEGYTHRFKIQFETGEPHYSNLDIYSNSDNIGELVDFINQKKSSKVISFKVIHKATKEQDDKASELINKTLKDI
jgi:hypothetical protein